MNSSLTVKVKQIKLYRLDLFFMANIFKISRLIKKFFITICCLLYISLANAQLEKRSNYDSTYYTSYRQMITTRFYFSQKYTRVGLCAKGETPDLIYRPNTNLNMGIGATYRLLTLNLAYGFDFLNDDKDKGETKYLDMQTHIYFRKWTIDLFGQFYKGYYLENNAIGYPGFNKYYIRPDVHQTLLGGAVYRVLNGQKFSFSAATLQNEWQKKSSGSLLIGAEIYYGSTCGDSALVPSTIAFKYDQAGINKIHFFKLGPGAGYAYTLVISKHLFITGAFIASINAGVVREFANNGSKYKFTISPHYLYRVALGYNSAVWACSFMMVGNEVDFKGASSSDKYFVSAGNYRVTFTKRLLPGPALKKKIKFIDNFGDRK